jgi:uracil-DNA glycosylase
VHVDPRARLLIISQAPGTKVHETGISFNDRSGDQLRAWLGLDRAAFYDLSRVAIMGMAFCYPGTDSKGGDLPPSAICAPTWHPKILPLLQNVQLTLLVGSYAQRRYLKLAGGESMTDIMVRWRTFLPKYFVLPHPSWRNIGWLKRNPWFDAEVLPELRQRVSLVMSGG